MQLMLSTFRLTLTAFLAASIVAAISPSARAETIYLRNGTQVTGHISREDATSFSVDVGSGRRKISKSDVDVLPGPDPIITFLTGIMVAGGGHIYTAQYDRAALYFTLGVIFGAAGYFATRQIHPSSPSAAVVAGIGAYFFPTIVGAFDAVGNAQRINAEPRYHVDYSAQ
jgi:hypothetical protein